MTGSWPRNEIDHKDCNPLNNSFDNLRESSHAENCRNTKIRRHNTTGAKGVFIDKRQNLKKWRVRIAVNNKVINIGRFYTLDEARAAYIQAAKRYHGEFARTA
jgi:hypothetical protein